MQAIDSTDFMADEQDEGLGGYADCEMIQNDAEPQGFVFANQDDLFP